MLTISVEIDMNSFNSLMGEVQKRFLLFAMPLLIEPDTE